MAEELDIDWNDSDFDRLLDEFINNELKDIEAEAQDNKERENDNKPSAEKIKLQNRGDDAVVEDAFAANLYQEERNLFEAYSNFRQAIVSMCVDAGIEIPENKFSAESIYPRFKPKCSALLTEDVVSGWRVMYITNPERMEAVDPNMSDEELLRAAENTTNQVLQLALISYVEVLIEVEGCEIAYDMRRAKYKRRKMEREIMEEHKRRQERAQKYIEAIKEKNFPIDAERLVSNYFKTAKKDPDGAWQVLINNPAVFAPIDVSKIPDRFFGLIKSKPQDGIRVNKEIGEFLRNLKV